MKVLFVDDEPRVLSGLRSVLFDLDTDYEIDACFATGGHEALALLEAGDIDVIVTDMRMPVMSGEDLLIEVRNRWPQVVRLVLSGHTESAIAYRVLPMVHDFLAKPAGEEQLRTALDSAHALLEGGGAGLALGDIDELPVRPDLLVRCQAVIERGGDAAALGAQIESDVVASAAMLHIANAAFFGFRTPATTPAEATVRLGTDATLAIIAQLGAQQLYPNVDDAVVRASAHAVDVAARAHAEDPSCPMLFTAALLHDIGQLVLLARGAPQYRRLLAGAPLDPEPCLDTERALFGVDHAGLGARLLERWRFDPAIVSLVEHHHAPERLDPELARLARIIEAAQRAAVTHDPGRAPVGAAAVLEGSETT
ncbi:MAG: HDOD domain-containing protein [Acidimicrobiia bacterium]